MSISLKDRILITGGAGFLGSFVIEKLKARGYTDIIVPRRREYDLTHEAAVDKLYADFSPAIVLHLAAEVGGIGANRENPGRFFFANAAMGIHLIEGARNLFLKNNYYCVNPGYLLVDDSHCMAPSSAPPVTVRAPGGPANPSRILLLGRW